ncbi:MAG: DUF5916 domain-containing protein [Chitinophagales bacterium]
MKRILFLFLLPMVCIDIEAGNIDTTNVEKVKKQMYAWRITSQVVIDGKIDEPEWQNAGPAVDFTQFQFKHNVPSNYHTEVRVMYDNTALYIGAKLFDPHPDSIMKELSQRDDLGAADFFDVIIDPFNDGLNANEFIVSSSNVQLDAKMYPNSNNGEDFAWDAVWVSETSINTDGWSVEIKIPYSAIRFPNTAEQTWGIQFVREVKRDRDKSSWNPIDPEIQGFVNQSGVLLGIKDIEAPLRLSVSPYLSAYYDVYTDNESGVHSNSTSFNGGADLKLGLNDAFTLDMTLIPDFGQVQSDNQVLNLTPFETYYVEQRQFFTEGTELFNKGGIFYSRRIGGTPFGFFEVFGLVDSIEQIKSNPQSAQLLNATKISGRTPGGTGIGLLNAIEGVTYATIEGADGEEYDYLTGPQTNYNVFVIDQNLKNNSYISLINSNVLRSGSYYDANVTATDFQLNDKKNIYGISGGGAASQKYFSSETDPEIGLAHHLRAGKFGGKWQYSAGYWLEDEVYDPNDLGFLMNNNTVNFNVNGSYHKYDPVWHFNQLNVFTESNYTRLVEPNEFFNLNTYTEIWGSFRNFTFAGIWLQTEPVITYDWFEPRVAGRYYTFPKNYNYGGWISTDYSNRFAFDANGNFRIFDEPGRNRLNINFSPRFRVNDKIALVASGFAGIWPNDIGWVNFYGDSIVFGRRDNNTFELFLQANYTPSVKMGFSLRARHYWSYAEYHEFYNLGEDGLLYPTTYNSFDAENNSSDDVNFNAFNIDFVYTWFFAPGSELNIVWKNSIYQFGTLLPGNYFDDLETTFNAPQSNNFSIKVLYYLDYLYLKKKV